MNTKVQLDAAKIETLRITLMRELSARFNPHPSRQYINPEPVTYNMAIKAFIMLFPEFNKNILHLRDLCVDLISQHNQAVKKYAPPTIPSEYSAFRPVGQLRKRESPEKEEIGSPTKRSCR